MRPWGAETLDRLSRGRFDRVFRIACAAAAAGLVIHLGILALSTHGLSRAAFPIVRPAWLALAIALAILPWFTGAARVALWSAAAGRAVRYADAIRIVLATELGAAVTPPTAGNLVVKLGLLARAGFPTPTAGALVLWGVIEDGAFFLLALPLAFRFSGAWSAPSVVAARRGVIERLPGILLLAAAVVAALGLATFLLARATNGGAKLPRPLGAATGAVRGLARRAAGSSRIAAGFARRGRWLVAPSLLLTALQWSARYSVVTALALAFGAPADPLLLFTLQWVVFTLSGLVPTPGGVGGAEGAFLAAGAPVFGPAILPGLLVLWRFATFHGLLLADAALLTLLGPGAPGTPEKVPSRTSAPPVPAPLPAATRS